MKKTLNLFILFIILVFNSCKKEPGIGGDASIYGKVYARHYNATFTTQLTEHYLSDTYVYIIYGNNLSYGQRIKTTYKGDFEFKYLYKGDYTIYSYSIDSAAIVNHEIQPPDSAVLVKVSITKSDQKENVGDMIVFK